MSLRLTIVLATMFCLAGCSGYGSSPTTPSPTPAPEGSTTVTIPSGADSLTTTAFGANPLTIAVGTTISWLNSDAITHTSAADGGQWSSGTIPPGGRFSRTFDSAGSFSYHCQIHPNMTGTIVVQ